MKGGPSNTQSYGQGNSVIFYWSLGMAKYMGQPTTTATTGLQPK